MNEAPAVVAARIGLSLPQNNQRMSWEQVLDLAVASYWRKRARWRSPGRRNELAGQPSWQAAPSRRRARSGSSGCPGH